MTRERERLIWVAVAAMLIAMLTWQGAGKGRYQYHSLDAAPDFQVFDTRTGNVVTYIANKGAWYRSDLSSNGGKATRISGPPSQKP